MSDHPVVQSSANKAAQFLLEQESRMPDAIRQIIGTLHQEIPKHVNDAASKGYTSVSFNVNMPDVPKAVFDIQVDQAWRDNRIQEIEEGVKHEFMTKWGGSHGEGLSVRVDDYREVLHIGFNFEATTHARLDELRKLRAGSAGATSAQSIDLLDDEEEDEQHVDKKVKVSV